MSASTQRPPLVSGAHVSSSSGAGAALPGWTRRLLQLLTVLGLVLPWFFNLRYFAGGGSVLPEIFFRDVSANALTQAITIDVYLAALAFSVWVIAERRVLRPWGYVIACFGLGLSFALPLYLLRRAPAPDR